MIDPSIRQEILRRLSFAEKEHGVRVLLAIESGSRAWGFASPDSDYDVRFIYAHDADWYLRVDLEEQRDVIEYDIVDDIDLNGWDVRKALRLFWKANPALVEWIQSPITYGKSGQFLESVVSVLPALYDPLKGVHHYRSMATSNYRSYLLGEQVRLKKYLYVMRPLLAARWIRETDGPPPIELERLMPMLDGHPEVEDALRDIVRQKMNAPELGEAPRVEVLNRFIESELESPVPDLRRRAGEDAHETLNLLFRAILAEA